MDLFETEISTLHSRLSELTKLYTPILGSLSSQGKLEDKNELIAVVSENVSSAAARDRETNISKRYAQS